MALNRLTIAEMVLLIEDWVTPGHPVRVALEQNPGLAALIPSIEGAYGLLVRAQPVELMEMRARLTATMADIDQRFDHLARAIDSFVSALTSLALAQGDSAKVDGLRALRRVLFPHQLRIVTMSYREEAGQTYLLAERLTPEQRAFMAAQTLGASNLDELVRAWIETGAELGALANQRTDLDLPSRQNSQVKARSRWIQAVTMVRSLVAMLGVSDPHMEEALGRISSAEADADKRGRPANRQPESEPEGDDVLEADESAAATPAPDALAIG